MILVFGRLQEGRCEMKWKKWVYFGQNTEWGEKSLIMQIGWVDERKSSQCVLEGWWQHGQGVNGVCVIL